MFVLISSLIYFVYNFCVENEINELELELELEKEGCPIHYSVKAAISLALLNI